MSVGSSGDVLFIGRTPVNCSSHFTHSQCSLNTWAQDMQISPSCELCFMCISMLVGGSFCASVLIILKASLNKALSVCLSIL